MLSATQVFINSTYSERQAIEKILALNKKILGLSLECTKLEKPSDVLKAIPCHIEYFSMGVMNETEGLEEALNILKEKPKLKSLALCGQGINDKILTAIANINTLSLINLSNNDISDTVAKALAAHPTLEKVIYSKEKISKKGKTLLDDLNYRGALEHLEMQMLTSPQTKNIRKLILEIKQLKRTGEEPTTSLIFVLTQTSLLLDNKLSPEKYQNFARQAQKATSPFMKRLGVLMMALGIALAAISGILFFPASMPIAFTGLAIATVTTTVGSSFFNQKPRNSNLSIKMTEVANEIEVSQSKRILSSSL